MSLTTAENLRLAAVAPQHAFELFPELEPLMKRTAGLLSGGEQQMLSLARALGRNPDALLLDELSLGLAPLVTARLFAAVREAATRGVGVLLVEQHVRLALDIADRVYVMERGQIRVGGTSTEIREHLDDIESAYLATAPAT